MPSHNHLELKVWILLQQFLVHLFPHLQFFLERNSFLLVIEQIPCYVSHLDYEHVLLQALFESELYALFEEGLVLDEIVDQCELVLEVVPDGAVFWTVVSERDQMTEVVVKLFFSLELAEVVALDVMFVDIHRLWIAFE